MRRSVLLGTTAAILLVGTAAATLAQQGPGFGPGSGNCTGQGPCAQGFGPGAGMGPGMGQGMGQGRGMRGSGGPGFERMCTNLDAKLAGMLAYTEAALKLTAEQQAGWASVEAAAAEAAQTVKGACDQVAGKQPPQTLPERLERMETMATTHATVIQTLAPVVTEFYGTLSEEQKATADQLGPMGKRGGWGGRHGGGWRR